MNKAMQLKAQVRNLATKNRVPAQAVLQSFMIERFLERISCSKYKDLVILKGGALIASLVGIASRTTMDIDATLHGYPLSETAIQAAFEEICAIVLPDGVAFVLNYIAPIRDDDEYGGYRVAIIASYEAINTSLKIDLTTGDVITPEAVRYTFRSIFASRDIEVWAYPIETIVAEKIETILRRGVLNTRPRDFYDVYIIMKTQQQAIDQEILSAALLATARKRLSLAALQNRDVIVQHIQADVVMRQRWERYRKDNFYAADLEFDDVIHVLKNLLLESKHNLTL